MLLTTHRLLSIFIVLMGVVLGLVVGITAGSWVIGAAVCGAVCCGGAVLLPNLGGRERPKRPDTMLPPDRPGW
jgi:hypothetical protein